MPYNHEAKRFRVVFADPDPLAGLVMVVRSATVDDYIRISRLADASALTAERVEELCEAMGPMLIEWDLSQDGQPVSADTAGLRSLDVPLAVRLSNEWLSAVGGVPAPLETPSRDGATFPEESLAMVPLSESQSS
jgi:hypothetical protein